MKHFTIAGHLGADPKLDSKGETTWASLRIAANGRKTDWFWVTAFGPLAESIAEHLKKGDGIAVSGELRSEEYKGREQVKLIATQATFFGKRA